MGKRVPPDANSLLSQGLLALLLLVYVALVYVAIVGAGVLVWRVVVGPAQDVAWWQTTLALAGIAVTIMPVSRWLRDRINDLVYAQHDDPYVLTAGIAQALRTMVSPRSTLPAIAESIAVALKVPYVAIETADGDPPWGCAYGSPHASASISDVPIAYLDQPLGTLRVADRGPGQGLSATDLTLLGDLAEQLGIALRAAQLSAELQLARERLVLAREEERRRIRNDLHDGLAPTLSALQLQLGSLRRLIGQDPAQAEALAAELGDDLRDATGAIRQLVYDLRPPMLDELTLVGALKSLRFSGSSVRFEVLAPEPMPTLPAAVEVALYRIASEAMHNVVRHAKASTCAVRIEAADGHLRLSVTDDGVSLPADVSAGVGLRSMRERAAELGGTLIVQSAPGGGTRVMADFPLQFAHG